MEKPIDELRVYLLDDQESKHALMRLVIERFNAKPGRRRLKDGFEGKGLEVLRDPTRLRIALRDRAGLFLLDLNFRFLERAAGELRGFADNLRLSASDEGQKAVEHEADLLEHLGNHLSAGDSPSERLDEFATRLCCALMHHRCKVLMISRAVGKGLMRDLSDITFWPSTEFFPRSLDHVISSALAERIMLECFGPDDIGRIFEDPELLKIAMSADTKGHYARLIDDIWSSIKPLEPVRMEHDPDLDALTGAVRQDAYGELLDVDIRESRKDNWPVSVIMVDLDHFKAVNDTKGHPMGDSVLRSVGQVLSGMVERRGWVARVGGDEFLVVLRNVIKEEASATAERIRAEVERLCQEIGASGLVQHGDKEEVFVTASLGVAEFPQDADSRETLYGRADDALYESKKRGRNCVSVYDGEPC